MTVDEIRELINLAAETGIAELEVQRGENRVRIRRASFAAQDVVIGAPTIAVTATPAAPVAQALPVADQPREKGDKPNDPTLVLVKSPIVGTFYEAASPELPPFVR